MSEFGGGLGEEGLGRVGFNGLRIWYIECCSSSFPDKMDRDEVVYRVLFWQEGSWSPSQRNDAPH